MRKVCFVFKPSIKFNVSPDVIIKRLRKKTRIDEIKKMEGYDVLVGWNTDAVNTEDGKQVSIAKYAKANNYGVYKINLPARPFVTNAINNNKYIDERESVVEQGTKAIQKGKVTHFEVLTALGMTGVKNIRDSIKNGEWRINRPSTLIRKLNKHKGKDNGYAPRPLIDTGQMIDRVTYVIVEKKDE